jgi:hypothetical protein
MAHREASSRGDLLAAKPALTEQVAVMVARAGMDRLGRGATINDANKALPRLGTGTHQFGTLSGKFDIDHTCTPNHGGVPTSCHTDRTTAPIISDSHWATAASELL